MGLNFKFNAIKKYFVITFLFAPSCNIYIRAKSLTVLTEPVAIPIDNHWYHKGVTESLLRGLKKLNIDFNFNPKNIDEIAETVVVLTKEEALTQAITLKQQGRIKKLLAGPNLVTFPSEQNGIMASPEIDVCIVPSEWVKSSYLEDMPSLSGRIACWPAGVDENYWSPSMPFMQRSTNQVLIYLKEANLEKTEFESLYQKTKSLLKKYNWNPIIIVYGSYDQEQFKNLLNQSKFAIFLSRSESQGIALTEAWAMDVPTLVWNKDESLNVFGKTIKTLSPAPYLTQQTGCEWKTFDDLETLLEQINESFATFSPRKWVIENMTDALCARQLLRIIDSTNRSLPYNH